MDNGKSLVGIIDAGKKTLHAPQLKGAFVAVIAQALVINKRLQIIDGLLIAHSEKKGCLRDVFSYKETVSSLFMIRDKL